LSVKLGENPPLSFLVSIRPYIYLPMAHPPSIPPIHAMALPHGQYSLPSPFSLLKMFLSIYSTRSQKTSEKPSPRCFDVDHDTGFVPHRPLCRLQSHYDLWEDALERAQDVVGLGDDDEPDALEKRSSSEQWRSQLASVSCVTTYERKSMLTASIQWPVLTVDPIAHCQRSLQRAHHVLAFLVHYYVHSIPSSRQSSEDSTLHVPEPLAIPFVDVSRKLGIAPVLTYADTVLWNWDLINPSKPATMDNIQINHTFSGTDDERNFYMVSLHVELRAVEMLQIVDEFTRTPLEDDPETVIPVVSRFLTKLKGVIDDLTDIMMSVRQQVNPHVFYWNIRPWFEGSDAQGPDGPCWIYDGISGSHQLPLSGPSGGQSSSIHLLDIFLDIDHRRRERRTSTPADTDKVLNGFMDRMRLYMPGKHREYLSYIEHLDKHRSLREIALRFPTLREPYCVAVKALQRLRDLHMQISCRYIVCMAKSSSLIKSSCPAAAMIAKMHEQRQSGNEPVRGTGGNELAALLKAGRDATKRAILSDAS
jgi:indoleamine 2,3-dioxygenase